MPATLTKTTKDSASLPPSLPAQAGTARKRHVLQKEAARPSEKGLYPAKEKTTYNKNNNLKNKKEI